MKVSGKNLRLLLLIAICFSLIGCGKSDEQKLIAESKEVTSWAASAQMIAEAWSQGRVPTPYAKRSFQNINQQLNESAARIQSLSDNHRPQLIATLQQLLSVVSQLEAASKHQDRSANNQLQEQLSQARDALNSIAKGSSQTR
jgi:CelD/BcsL family acetyltransferase involved in cellulose biosynthesis